MLNFRKIQKITVLTMLLFLSSTILIATKTNISFSEPSGDGELAATSTTMVYVDPPNVTKSVGETFTIDVVIADVASLYGIDIQFKWDPSILEYVNHTLKIPVDTYADGILSEPGMFIKNEANGALGTYWSTYASFDPAPAFDGTGIAFSMTFNPLKPGGCALEFPLDPRTGVPYIDLSNKAGWPISYTWQDGYFETVGTPQASFTYQPQIGVVGKPISFNASESNTPDGTIVEYYWDFADENKAASTSAEISHAFNDPGMYDVSLIVENDAGVNSSATVGEKPVTIVESRNIKIMSVSLSTILTVVNSTVQANVTIKNTGYTTENSTLTGYYNTSATEWTMIAAANVTNLKSGDTKKYSFNWNTTGVETEKYYVIKANATAVPYGNETDNTKISEPVYITSKRIHDLAVENLMLQATYGVFGFTVPVIFGESAIVTVGIKNLGSVPEESYNVVIYSNSSSLNEWDITDALRTGATNILTYKWDDISQCGLYNITVRVTITTDDNDTRNNQIQQMMHVIETPILNITYTPETLLVNQTITLNASSSVHGDPDGQITSYYWEIFAPGQKVEEVPRYKSAESEISVSYNFTEAGNWTIVLRVKDNYGITYVGKRSHTIAYRLEEKIYVEVEGDGENGEGDGGIPIEYIAIIIVVVVAAIAALVLVRRRRSGLTPTE